MLAVVVVWVVAAMLGLALLAGSALGLVRRLGELGVEVGRAQRNLDALSTLLADLRPPES